MATTAKTLLLMGKVQDALDDLGATAADPDFAPFARIIVNGFRTGDHHAASEAAIRMLDIATAKLGERPATSTK